MSLIALGIGAAVSLGTNAIQKQIDKKRLEEEERKRAEYEAEISKQELSAQGDKLAANNLNTYNPEDYTSENKSLYFYGGLYRKKETPCTH